MTLSKTVLSNALAFVPRYSFTRQALLAATPQAAQADLVESLFGTGEEPARNLVREWEEQGLGAMALPATEGKGIIARGKAQREVDFAALKSALGRRIQWSSDVGEHLVQVRPLCHMCFFRRLMGPIGTCVAGDTGEATISPTSPASDQTRTNHRDQASHGSSLHPTIRTALLVPSRLSSARITIGTLKSHAPTGESPAIALVRVEDRRRGAVRLRRGTRDQIRRGTFSRLPCSCSVRLNLTRVRPFSSTGIPDDWGSR